MGRAPQRRRLETRAKLLTVAAEIIDSHGVSALRVEDVVAQAGVAKGTFFSHFGDKDGLLAVILGARVMRYIEDMEDAPAPSSPAEIAQRLAPLLDFISQDRIIFDLLLRYSGTTGAEIEEVVTEGFLRQIALFIRWITNMQAKGQISQNGNPELLAEGIQGFLNHVLATGFCMEHSNTPPPSKALVPYLEQWLLK
ncbi:transcriptional regulator, TetR family [Ruegeria sp. TM1040]|uniref:TetR/AcrR family transcriptional regulator n=1 Tax=Ruegeria sp. (strain TM1040) TaxID=292414 RepID=UPI0000556A0C|nr:TetR/AcrR family transcriptional regulator [Ruegeria sp. TM1040]ABF62738.1 transcriptional regulator, TetR family [Ruegeria sp. TM1040]MDF9304279.1 TetR/AcrR family transcriptional regulator [Tritonibacter mobilis]